jgi:hypothetical protein
MITKAIARQRAEITPQGLEQLIESHPMRIKLLQLLSGKYRQAVASDSPIPLAALGSIDCDWDHANHGKLFDAVLCVSYDATADRFSARCWARTGRRLFDPHANELIRGADGVALNQLLQRHSRDLADGCIVIQFAHNHTTIHRGVHHA